MSLLQFPAVRNESGLKQRTSMHLDATLEIATLALTTIYSVNPQTGQSVSCT